MKKIIRKPEQDQHIFSEGIDYSKTEKTSIWGTGDKDTLELLKKTEIRGRWLNLAAGDGRYNLTLLEKANYVVASDIDESALNKLRQNTPNTLKPKLKTEVFDITKKFPFENNSFDGVFCTGTLHIFSREILESIIIEIDRVLKYGGKVLIDFAADVKRIRWDGKPYIIKDEPKYTLAEARTTLKDSFRKYKIKMYESDVPEELLKEANPPYKFSCNFILLIADKKINC
ncbi:class I SAM-dependent methyltransferase [Candidatus Woesearchaeota archaeon]|nr:class I SAM-dependent methyltransferase [Candidatus Woesearchaeota archaeon]